MDPEPSSLLSEDSDQHPALEGKGNPEEGEKDLMSLPLPNGSQQAPKRGRGRPLGSVNKTPKPVKIPGKRGRPRKIVLDMPVKSSGTVKKRGRPPKVIKVRGRPRKIPLTPEEEEERKKMKGKPKGPRVWKPLGRPRIYPREDPPVPPATTEPRGRGRPRKVSRQGAHLRKNAPLSTASDSTPRKRGRPAGSSENSLAKKQIKANKDKEQKSSPPPTKRSRQSGVTVEEPQVEKSGENAEEQEEGDTETSQNEGPGAQEPGASGDRAESGDPNDDEASVPVVSQRKRGRPRGSGKPAAQEEKAEEEEAARNRRSGRKAAVPKKSPAGKGNKNEKPGRENISSIL